MVSFEQVERLREKARVSFEDAKAALEATNGDLLDALIYLERQGKVAPPSGGGYYSSESSPGVEKAQSGEKENERRGESFSDMMKRFGRFCSRVFAKGNSNFLEAEKSGSTVFSLPVTALVVLLIFLFWVVVPLFIVSLFFGFRYRFIGSDLGKESVNKVMDDASSTADHIKNSFNNQGK